MKTVAGVVGGGFGGPPKKASEQEITAAIKWSLEDENVTTIIPGWQTFDQIHSTIAVMSNLKMTVAERSLLNNIKKRRGYCVTSVKSVYPSVRPGNISRHLCAVICTHTGIKTCRWPG
jgi:hypothetical protein